MYELPVQVALNVLDALLVWDKGTSLSPIMRRFVAILLPHVAK